MAYPLWPLSHVNQTSCQESPLRLSSLNGVCVCLGYSLCCHSQLPWLDVELKLVPIYVAVLVAALLAQSKVAIIITGGVGKNGSTVAVSEVAVYVHVWKSFPYNVRASVISCEILFVCFLTDISQVSLKFCFLWKTQIRHVKTFVDIHHLVPLLIATVSLVSKTETLWPLQPQLSDLVVMRKL